MKHKFDFYTSHNQFYIVDKEADYDTGADSFWTDEASVSRMPLGYGVVGVGTECYGPVKGELNILNEANTEYDLSDYNHIVEGYLELFWNITDYKLP